MTGSRPASPPTGVISVADFLDEEEIEAAGAARIREDGIVVVARSALGAADLSANMLDERETDEGEKDNSGGGEESVVSSMAKWNDRTSIFYDAGAWASTNERRPRIIANTLGLNRVFLCACSVDLLMARNSQAFYCS